MNCKYSLVVLICFLLVLSVQSQTNVIRPNIIFILTDDLGYGDIGVFYQNIRKQKNNPTEPWFSTPNLDQMANNGAMLTDHYCGAPVCAPSRASLLSGLSQGQSNVRDNQFDKALDDDYTLGNVLQKAGYHTAAIGKWGLQGHGDGPDWPAHPLKRGFDYFYGYMRHRDGHEHYPKEAIYRNKATVWENYNDVTSPLDKCYTGDLWTAAAKKWIMEEQKDKQPFFLYLAYDLPHAALELPTGPYPSGTGVNGGIQWTGTPGHMINTANGIPDSWIDPMYMNATWDHDQNNASPEQPWPETYKRYATIVSRMDQYVGDLLALLKELQIDRNTLVVFTSDNGPSDESYLPAHQVPNNPNFFNSFGPFDGIKRDVWEGGVRVPAIVTWPGNIPSATILSAPSAFYDWLPTFVEAVGLPVPSFSDGYSFFPLLTGKLKTQSRSVYIEYYQKGRTPGYKEFDSSHRKRERNQMQMLRINDTLAVRYNIQSASDDFEIYQINTDPQQVTNLALTVDETYQQEFFKNKVLQLRHADTSAKRPYDTAIIASTIKSVAVTKGISWKFYKGNYLWIPSVNNLMPYATGNALKFSGVKLKKNKEGIIYYEGLFNAVSDGTYEFQLETNVPFLMKMYEINLFNQDFSFEKSKIYSSTIYLKKGMHPFRIYARKDQGGKQLFSVSYKSQDMKTAIPVNSYKIVD